MNLNAFNSSVKFNFSWWLAALQALLLFDMNKVYPICVCVCIRSNKNIASAQSTVQNMLCFCHLLPAGPKGLQRARSARMRPKAARASVARPLYLKLLTRQTKSDD